MACECPKKKQQSERPNQPSHYKPQYDPKLKKKPFGSKNMGQRFWKKNQFHYKLKIQMAYIEEEAKEPEDQGEDEYIGSLAACTAKLSKNQRGQWVEEMQDLGINFQ